MEKGKKKAGTMDIAWFLVSPILCCKLNDVSLSPLFPPSLESITLSTFQTPKIGFTYDELYSPLPWLV